MIMIIVKTRESSNYQCKITLGVSSTLSSLQ